MSLNDPHWGRDSSDKEPKKEETKTSGNDLNSKTVAELKEMAKESGIENYTSMKKAELIDALK